MSRLMQSLGWGQVIVYGVLSLIDMFTGINDERMMKTTIDLLSLTAVWFIVLRLLEGND